MITENDLREAIAECEGQRNPTANTCLKLAAFYTIRDKMYPQWDKDKDRADCQNQSYQNPKYSYSTYGSREYVSDTEFMSIVKDLPINKVLEVLDETMSALSVLNPKLYQASIRKLLDD